MDYTFPQHEFNHIVTNNVPLPMTMSQLVNLIGPQVYVGMSVRIGKDLHCIYMETYLHYMREIIRAREEQALEEQRALQRAERRVVPKRPRSQEGHLPDNKKQK